MLKRHSIRVFPVEDVTTISTHEVDPADVGLKRAQVEKIWKACTMYYKTGLQPAMALCVRHRGQVILDRAVGHAWGNGPDDAPDTPKKKATPDTLYNLFSGSKPFVAMLVHHLAQEGALELDQYVADFMPAFRDGPRGKVTIRHLLEHRAGFPTTGGILDLDLLMNPEEIKAHYHDAPAWYRPGRKSAYHAISSGFVLGDLVKIITGDDINAYMRKVICDPLGIPTLSWGVPADRLEEVARDRFTGFEQPRFIKAGFRRAFGATLQDIVELTDDDRFLTGIVPSGNCLARPRDASRFFELLLRRGTLDGHTIFEPEIVHNAVREATWGEFDNVLGAPIRYAAGFMLGARLFSIYGRRTSKVFGHLGLSNVLVWADPERDISVCLMTTGKPVITPEATLWIRIPHLISATIPRIHKGRRV